MDIDRLKQRCNLITVMESEGFKMKFVSGKATTRCFTGHASKSGTSFTVDSERYKCWNCGIYGDVFSFIQQYKNMTFRESLVYLAERYAPELIEDTPRQEKRSIRYDVMQDIFVKTLLSPKNSEIRQYLYTDLKRRHLNPNDVIRTYQLGFVKQGVLSWMLTQKLITTEELETAGFMKGGAFLGENRVSIPLIKNGKIVGYSLRAVDDTQPKYLNLMNKNESYNDFIYNLDNAKEKEVVVCEGVFDAIRVSEQGYPAVAMLGTKFNARKLTRFSKVILFYDGDNAGVEAMTKAFFQGFKELNMIYSANNEHESDPCELDDSKINYCIGTAKPVIEYITKRSFRYGIPADKRVKFALDIVSKLKEYLQERATPFVDDIYKELARMQYPELYKQIEQELRK